MSPGDVELSDWFEGRRPWRQLRVILDRLPNTSRYVVAKRNDPELALQVARESRERKAAGKGGKWSPPAHEWDTTAELIAALLDRMGEVEAVLLDLPIAGKKRQAKPPKRTARPRTAVEDAEEYLAREHVEDIIADVEGSYVTVDEYKAIEAEVTLYRDQQQQTTSDV